MNINKFNAEGYCDPTAYKAISNIYKQERKSTFKPLVYICSPYSGNIAANEENARRYCRFALEHNAIPLAPHLLYPQFMDENSPAEREMGLLFGIVLLGKCSKMWVFGDRISSGMAAELDKAKRKNQPIRYFTDKCEEVNSK